MNYLTRKDADLGDGLFDSIAWAMETHCHLPDTGEYQTATLSGNEDAPTEIAFYRSVRPTWFSQPDFIWKAEREGEGGRS